MNPNFRNFALWAIIALLLIALFSMFQTSPAQTGAREIPYSQFLREVDASRVKEVVITGNKVIGSYVETGTTFQTYSPTVDDGLMARLEAKNVVISARPETDGSSGFLSYIGTLLPMLLILGVWLVFMRQMQGGSRRNSTISSRSCLASSTPATSWKVTRPCASVRSFAFDLPKPIARPEPDCIWRMKNIQTPRIRIIGSQEIR